MIPIWKISKHIERISNINFKMFLQFIIPYILIILLIRVYNMVVQAIQFNHGWSSDPQFETLANLSSSRYVIGAWIQNVIPQRWGKLGKYLGQTKWDILQLKIQQRHIRYWYNLIEESLSLYIYMIYDTQYVHITYHTSILLYMRYQCIHLEGFI